MCLSVHSCTKIFSIKRCFIEPIFNETPLYQHSFYRTVVVDPLVVDLVILVVVLFRLTSRADLKELEVGSASFPPPPEKNMAVGGWARNPCPFPMFLNISIQ